MTFNKFHVPLMLTVHQMPLKNYFLTGIISGYDKISYQNKPRPNTMFDFASDCQYDVNGKESCHRARTAFTETEILYYSLTNPGFELVLCARGFDCIRDNFEMETAKSI